MMKFRGRQDEMGRYRNTCGNNFLFLHRIGNGPWKRPQNAEISCTTIVQKIWWLINPSFAFCTVMKIGYARVSTDAQETHLQMDALKRAKCARVYQEKVSATKAERPELIRLLDNARKGDVVIVWKLDHVPSASL
jgi:Resolvase, N terminal domain